MIAQLLKQHCEPAESIFWLLEIGERERARSDA